MATSVADLGPYEGSSTLAMLYPKLHEIGPQLGNLLFASKTIYSRPKIVPVASVFSDLSASSFKQQYCP